MIVGAVIGVFVANPSCNLEAFTSFNVDGQYMFPILFVTIACGAVSGFHSLVSSGTASKQIKNEKNMLPVSFGAMLMESMLAVIALIAVASFAKGEAAAQGLTTQPQIFAGAIANFLSSYRSATFTCIYTDQPGSICICIDITGFCSPCRTSVVPGILYR